MADSTGLGYRGSALVIAGVLVVVALLYYFTAVSRTALFWAAFVLTRPLGATIANTLDKPRDHGGLGISDLYASAAFAILIIICILVLPQKAGKASDSGER